MQAAGPPSLALALAALDVYSREAGVRIALISGIVLLAGWGWRIGRRAELTTSGTLLAAGLSASLGVFIVLLELAIH
jgi:hypothetical protein